MKSFLLISSMVLCATFSLLAQNADLGLTSEERKLFRLAYNEYTKQNFSMSLDLFDSLILIDNSIRNEPVHCRAIEMKGAVLYKMNHLDSALKTFHEAASCSKSGKEGIWNDFGLIFYTKEEYDSAEYYFKNGLNNSSAKYIEYYFLAQIKKAKGKHNNALEYMSKCITDCQQSYDPIKSCKEIFYLRVETYHIIEEDSLAQLDIQQHLEIYPSDSSAIQLKEKIINSLSN